MIFKLFHLEPGVEKDALHLETLQLLEGVAVVVHMSRERETEAHGAARRLSPPSTFAAPGQDSASGSLHAAKILHLCDELQES